MKEHPAAKGRMWSVPLEIQALWQILAGEHQLITQLDPHDFYDPMLRAVFLGMIIDLRENKDVQFGSLDIILSENDRYHGLEWLLQVLRADFNYIADYRTAVRELKKLRAKREAREFRSSAESAEAIPQEFQAKAKQIQDQMLQKVNPMKDLAERIKQGVEVIPTGFHTLDMMCGGGIEKGGIMTIPAI
ncbi:MAG: hypothetical protein QF442_01845, partial [Candidatus Peribacteraceae bacterium]|nr:hypothetical protein [Candidatus Peribacteraceae bacterium]